MRTSRKLLKALAVILILSFLALPATASAPDAADQSIRQGTMPPALDGNLSDWDGVPAMVLDLDTRAPNSSGGVERSDAMYTLQMLQTSEALYLGFHARDDKIVMDSGADLHKDDSLRFSIDGNKDGNGGSPSDHSFRIRLDDNTNDSGGPKIDAVEVFTATTPVGYNMEVKIPASVLALPLGSTSFKFNWAAGDDDNGSGLDTFYLYAGTQADTPEPSWPTARLDGEAFTPVGLLEAGRWEWYGGGTLGAIYAGGGNNVWAAGNGVWKGASNGTSWSRFPLLASAPVKDIRFWDANRGLALAGDKVYLTEDSGATWRLSYDMGINRGIKLTTASTDSAWLAVSVPDSHGGYLYDAVVQSRDGGASWQWVLNTGDAMLEDIAAYGADLAWVLEGIELPACKTMLRRSMDAGRNWASVCLSDGDGPIFGKQVAFGDSVNGWLVGEQNNGYDQVWRTTDGGDTWQKQSLGVQGVEWLTAYDSKNAWLSAGGKLYKTTDGATWYFVSEGAPSRVSFRNASEGWGIQGRTIRRTTNGGASWNTVYTPADSPMPHWWDHLRGWRINGAVVERTLDGGGTWLSANTGLLAVQHLQMVSPQMGWAWHEGSLSVKKTTDGGATWKTQVTGSDALYDLQFVSATHGWVRDTTNNLRRTTDGGQTWTLVTPPPMPDPVSGSTNSFNVSVYFVNANVGIAGVTHYSGYWDCASFYSRTTDGGITWNALQAGPSEAFTFGSGQIGWGGASCDQDDHGSNALSKTANGGATWMGLIHPNFDHVDLHAPDADQLFAFGSNQVDKSSDGGVTFQRQRTEDQQLTLRSRIDRVYHEEPESTTARLIYRSTEIPAYRTVNPPRMDGNLDDWGRAWQTSLKTSNASALQGGIPSPLESSAILRAVWDANNLYLAVQVYDGEIYVDSPDKPWMDDGVLIGLDPAHDHVYLTPDDDRQYMVTADGAQYLWGAPTTGLEVGQQQTENGYILEIRIPKHRVPSLKLQAGGVAGFNWTLIDDIDGGPRETSLGWTSTSTSRADGKWGQIRFSAIDAETNPSDATPTPTPSPTATATPTETPSATPTATPTGQTGFTLSGKVWNDLNGNALIEPGEPGVLGMMIRLYKGSAPIDQTYSDTDGSYQFTNLLPGAYKLIAQQPAWLPLSTTLNEIPILITSGNVAVNFGDWTGWRTYLPMITK